METMTVLSLVFDVVLGLALIWLAWRALVSQDLFKGIVLFIAFGLMMALAWVRLEAPDIALAEAAIGAGLTGALLLAALARLQRKDNAAASHDKDGGRKVMTRQAKKAVIFRILLAGFLSVLALGLGYAVLSLSPQAPGLSVSVADNLMVSGVSNPVTAVLLNFRGYDTLLEMAVLLLALLGVWSIGFVHEQQEAPPGPVLVMLSRLLVPLLILVAGYLLWVGGHAPGGAFQAGSVLAAAGVLLFLSGWHPEIIFSALSLRLSLVLGLVVFMAVGVAMLFLGGQLLDYPASFAGTLILLIEAAATISIGVTLAALFLGWQPGKRIDK